VTGKPQVPPEWLQTNITQGLSDAEIEKRRQAFGYNELQRLAMSFLRQRIRNLTLWNSSQKENQVLKFIGYFRGPILYVMEIAVILSAGLRDFIDFGVIVSLKTTLFLRTEILKAQLHQIGILFLNAGVGWYQEKCVGLLFPLCNIYERFPGKRVTLLRS
jgi:H+-transporting ATPase